MEAPKWNQLCLLRGQIRAILVTKRLNSKQNNKRGKIQKIIKIFQK